MNEWNVWGLNWIGEWEDVREGGERAGEGERADLWDLLLLLLFGQ